MEHEAATNAKTGLLPVQVTGPVELGRLLRELEQVDEQLRQLQLRKDGEPVKLPATGILLDKTVETNNVNLLVPEERTRLKQFLNSVKAKAPVMHMSFSADPSPRFVEIMVTWIRKELHPLALVTIGLQPNIGAGCVVRTTNKYFDFSLREDMKNKSEVLIAALRKEPVKVEITDGSEPLAPAPAAIATSPVAPVPAGVKA